MLIYLIRHGEKAAKKESVMDIELTPKGLRQADLTGERLTREGIQRIYSSDMLRALQTARGINGYLHVPMEVRPGLREIDRGDFDLFDWEQACAKHPEFEETFERHEIDVPYPGGESGADVWNRARPVMEEILGAGLERAAVVAHGGTIRCILSGALGLPQARRFFFGNPPEHCGITILRYECGRCHLQSFNDFAHLGDCR